MLSLQSRMAKLRKHHNECLSRHKISEEERSAKERQQTMYLLKRAQLLQELAKLDTLVSNVNRLTALISTETSSSDPLYSTGS